MTIEKTTDEFGVPRFFVERAGDWIAGPFDTYDIAAEKMEALTPNVVPVARVVR